MVMDYWIAASNNGFRCRGRPLCLPRILTRDAHIQFAPGKRFRFTQDLGYKELSCLRISETKQVFDPRGPAGLYFAET